LEKNKNKTGGPTIFILNLNSPQPFGLILGKSEKYETGQAVEKEGGRRLADRRLRPATSVVDVEGLQIEHLHLSQFWFYLNVLFAITYRFQVSLDKKEFHLTFEKLKNQYGYPIKYTKPHKAEAGLALWKFGELEVELNVSSVSEYMCLEYRHLPLFIKAAEEEASLSYSSERREIKTDEKGL
jgi:hypothetical protein